MLKPLIKKTKEKKEDFKLVRVDEKDVKKGQKKESKRGKFVFKRVDEADGFSRVAGKLRKIADDLEAANYSEEARLEAIRALMPLVGKMRAGISVN